MDDDWGIWLIVFGLFLIFGAEVCYTNPVAPTVEEKVKKERIYNPSPVIQLPHDPSDSWR